MRYFCWAWISAADSGDVNFSPPVRIDPDLTNRLPSWKAWWFPVATSTEAMFGRGMLSHVLLVDRFPKKIQEPSRRNVLRISCAWSSGSVATRGSFHSVGWKDSAHLRRSVIAPATVQTPWVPTRVGCPTDSRERWSSDPQPTQMKDGDRYPKSVVVDGWYCVDMGWLLIWYDGWWWYYWLILCLVVVDDGFWWFLMVKVLVHSDNG